MESKKVWRLIRNLDDALTKEVNKKKDIIDRGNLNQQAERFVNELIRFLHKLQDTK